MKKKTCCYCRWQSVTVCVRQEVKDRLGWYLESSTLCRWSLVHSSDVNTQSIFCSPPDHQTQRPAVIQNQVDLLKTDRETDKEGRSRGWISKNCVNQTLLKYQRFKWHFAVSIVLLDRLPDLPVVSGCSHWNGDVKHNAWKKWQPCSEPGFAGRK